MAKLVHLKQYRKKIKQPHNLTQTRPKLKHEPCKLPQEQVVSFGAQKG